MKGSQRQNSVGGNARESENQQAKAKLSSLAFNMSCHQKIRPRFKVFTLQLVQSQSLTSVSKGLNVVLDVLRLTTKNGYHRGKLEEVKARK